MSRTVTDYGKSMQKKVLNLSRDRGISNEKMLIKYILDRLLYRISISEYLDNFILKGSSLAYVFLQEYSRVTRDIDLLAQNISNDCETIKNVFKEICSLTCEVDGLLFDLDSITVKPIQSNKKYAGNRVSMVALLGKSKTVIKFDIGYDEVITPGAMLLNYPSLFPNLPATKLYTYNLETVLAEKIETMISREEDNTRMKDYYDIWNIMTHCDYNESLLKRAIKNTCEHRNTVPDKNSIVFSMEFYTINKKMILSWNSFLKKCEIPYISFTEIGEFICKNVRSLI